MRLPMLPMLLAVAGCVPGPGLGGGSPSGDLAGEQGDLAPATAGWALVDLASGAITWRVDLPDLTGNAAYRDRILVFRRTGSGAGECLVGAFELTQAQWRRLSGDAPGSEPWAAVPLSVVPAPARSGDRPAFNLDYEEVAAVLAGTRLSHARLAVPTAAQWEVAAGGSTGWAWGGAGSAARLRATALVRDTADGVAGQRPVGQGQPTGAGFYDLHGNVREWIAPGTAVRGGSWADDANDCRIEMAAGPGLSTTLDHALVGVRLVLVP